MINTRVLWARCPSHHPMNSVEALKEAQSTDPNQWHHPFFSYLQTPDRMGEVAPFMPAL